MAFRDKLDDAERALSWGERIWTWAQMASAGGLAAWAGWTAVVKYLDGLPVWASIFIGLLLATTTMRLLFWWKQRSLLRGVKKLDVSDVAARCEQLYRDFSDFMAGQQQLVVHGGQMNPHDEWQTRVNHSNRVANLVMQRFAPRVHALAHEIQTLGIPAPNLFHFSAHDSGGAMVYIGMVGELLSRGHLDEARKLDPKATWGATFRI